MPPCPQNRVRSGGDPRWTAAQSVVESRYFARSPLLSKFLLFVVNETLEGRPDEITEHQIGVRVFGRLATYKTVEDNIVRNYARQLRKRLSEYYVGANDATIRIEIPVGGYVPVFLGLTTPLSVANRTAPVAEMVSLPTEEWKANSPPLRGRLPKPVLWTALVLSYSIVLVTLTWFGLLWWRHTPAPVEPSRTLWHAMLASSKITYIVPPDVGFNLVEDISHHSVPLSEYIGGRDRGLPLSQLDAHSAADIRSDKLTDFENVQLMVAISRLKDYDPARVFLRFPRDLRMDDLKNANAILIGSVCSNPWVSLKGAYANFTIVCGDNMEGSSILNRAPETGESRTYISHWNEPTHETYALVSFLPNLNGRGHILTLEGLDTAGTQAAAEALLETEAINPILKRATRPDGSIAPFEVLLRSKSIDSSATDTQIIASRIHAGN